MSNVFGENRPSYIPNNLILNFLSPQERAIPGEEKPIQTSIFSNETQNTIITRVLSGTDHQPVNKLEYIYLIYLEEDALAKFQNILDRHSINFKKPIKGEANYLIVTEELKNELTGIKLPGRYLVTKAPRSYQAFLQALVYLDGERNNLDTDYQSQGVPAILDPLTYLGFTPQPTGDSREWKPDETHKYAYDFNEGMSFAIGNIAQLFDEAYINLPLTQGVYFNPTSFSSAGFEKRTHELVEIFRKSLERHQRKDKDTGKKYYSLRDTIRVVGHDDGYNYALRIFIETAQYFDHITAES